MTTYSTFPDADTRTCTFFCVDLLVAAQGNMQVTADTTVPDQDETVNQLLSLPMLYVDNIKRKILMVSDGSQ